MVHDLKFGFRPSALDLTIGPVTIETLDGLEQRVTEVEQSDQCFKEWVYAPLQRTKIFPSGEILQAPYSSRVFGLPNTHIIRHLKDVEREHLEFHIWSLGFFTGQRLTATEAGFLDATPLKPGKLNDFFLVGDSLSKAVQLAEAFWQENADNREQLARVEAAIHALFLAQNPNSLQFEEFIFLYTALDACFKIMQEMRCAEHVSHAERIEWMCDRYSIPVPDWARTDDETEIAELRNPTIHEGLYVNAPLGFSIWRPDSGQNLNLQMQALVCRLLVAIMGGAEVGYVKTAVTSRQRKGLSLS